MTKNYLILYKGVLAGTKINRKAAEAKAFELIKEKGWEAKDVDVKERA